LGRPFVMNTTGEVLTASEHFHKWRLGTIPLSRLDDAEVFFDTADRYAASLAQYGDSAVVAAGGHP
jgi:hypothetical protein